MRVRIRLGAKPIDERDCRLITLPDGRDGAIWRGLAFPLIDGAIDAESAGTAPELCRPAQERGSVGYALRETVDGLYVFLRGAASERDRVTLHLARAGLPVARTGRYLGEALPDLNPDWFLRLAAASAEDVAARVAEALGSSAPVGDAPGDLRDRVLAHELERALTRLETANAERDALKAKASELQEWRRQAAETTELAEAERRLREAAERQAAEAQRLFDALQAERNQRPAPRVARGVADEIDDVLASLLPRIRLIRDTRDVVATEFASRQGFYRALAEIDRDEQGIPPEWKSVKGATGWIERHVSTGQDNTGRAYARLDKSVRRWDVLVSFKGDQPRDIDWLKNN